MFSKTYENYLESIYVTILRKGLVKTNDIARDLKVTPPSITEMLLKLKKRGYINHEKYGVITLTKKGERIAKKVKIRHDTITKLLELVLVSEKTAEKDACRIEHVLSPETIRQLTKFVRFLEEGSPDGKWIGDFKKFSRKRK